VSDLSELSELLALLHSAPLEPANWTRFMELMRRLFPHTRIALSLERELAKQKERAGDAEAALDRMAVAAFCWTRPEASCT